MYLRDINVHFILLNTHYILLTFSGTPVYVNVNVAPIFNEDHNIVMYMVCHEEIQAEIKDPPKQSKRKLIFLQLD